MKPGGAVLFHKDQYENRWQGEASRVSSDRMPRRFRPLQPKWLRRRSTLLREASLYNP